MTSFAGDYYGKRCKSGTRSGDVFNDYLDFLNGVAWDDSSIKWRLDYLAPYTDYEFWEHHMKEGFYRCDTYERLDQSTRLVLALRRVDEEVTRWWNEEMYGKDITYATWRNFIQFLRACFLSPRCRVSCTKPVKVTNVVQRRTEFATRLQPCSKEVAMSISPPAMSVKAVVPVQTVSAAVPKISDEKQPDVDKVVVCAEIAVEKVEPLSGLNMQLKRVHDEACKIIDKGQRWSLFQTQCMIKGKHCKLMFDGGSCTNGISKAMVVALGLSTWRIPEPKHLEWLNTCGMLKVTHKVRVPFTVGDYVDEVECDVLPLEVCGLLLGRPWQYDCNVTHAGRANTYSFMHDGKQQILKPMKDDQIKSDVELVLHKEKLHKAEPKQRLAKLQQVEHDARSVGTEIDSTMHVDDKPVFVGDKLVEDKPLLEETKGIAACVPVCVDKGVQTNYDCVDHVSVHVVPKVDDHSYVSSPVRSLVGAAVRMHTGRDGRVRQLCGPGITILQGRAKQVHVQRYKCPARVEKKKKMVAPTTKLVWRRKEVYVPMETRDVSVHITSPFRADPHALGATLFEGGEDDMGRTEEVKPNFRTPPS